MLRFVALSSSCSVGVLCVTLCSSYGCRSGVIVLKLCRVMSLCCWTVILPTNVQYTDVSPQSGTDRELYKRHVEIQERFLLVLTRSDMGE